MRFRLTAFGLHLLGSACALSLVLGGLWLGWYHWPGWFLTGVTHVLWIVPVVDLVIGPALTLIIANPAKPRRELTRDIAMIATVQLVALSYGAATLWQGRPLYYAYSSDRLELVQASDLHADEIALARQQRSDLAPHWYSRVRWVWAALPENPDEAAKIVNGTLFGKGQDVIDMPRYFRPWTDGLTLLRKNLQPIGDIRYVSRNGKARLAARMQRMGLAAGERNAMIMWGNGKPLVAIFDPQSAQIRAILKGD
jgi:hypothetical protein